MTKMQVRKNTITARARNWPVRKQGDGGVGWVGGVIGGARRGK